MLGIDSKREIITGEFARKIWNEVQAFCDRDKVPDSEEIVQNYEVEWV